MSVYWHAFEVVRAHGESGITARLEPATIDGLVYSSSMVVLYAARHRLPVPGLARWLLALGILATLAANVAHGWSHGPVGAAVAAWPAASLVGSYELLLWLIRTAAAGAVAREPAAVHGVGPADHPVTGLRLVPAGDQDLPADAGGPGRHGSHGGPGDRCAGPVVGSGRAGGPDEPGADREYRLAAQETTGWSDVDGADAVGEDGAKDINEAAAAAYRASIDSGQAAVRAQARRPVRQDLPPLGPPPHGRGYGPGGGVKIAWVPTRRQMTWAWPGMRSSP